MDNSEFEKYKDEHYFEYQLKFGLLSLSTAIFLALLGNLIIILSNKIFNEVTWLNALALVSVISFVIIPISLVRFKTFDTWREALGHSVFVSWRKIIWAWVQSLFLMILFVWPDFAAVTVNRSRISDYFVFPILIAFFAVYFFLQERLTFLAPESLKRVYLSFTVLKGTMKKRVYALIAFYIFSIFLFGVIFYLFDEGGFREEDADRFKTFWDYLYFSTITITSTGYGDVAPVDQARLFAGIEAILGNLYIPLSFAVILGKKDGE